MSAGGALVRIYCVLLSNPFDQLVQLDRLFRSDQFVGVWKSVFTGALSSSAGGSG
jgi:hypothetical protein